MSEQQVFGFSKSCGILLTKILTKRPNFVQKFRRKNTFLSENIFNEQCGSRKLNQLTSYKSFKTCCQCYQNFFDEIQIYPELSILFSRLSLHKKAKQLKDYLRAEVTLDILLMGHTGLFIVFKSFSNKYSNLYNKLMLNTRRTEPGLQTIGSNGELWPILQIEPLRS